MKCECWGSSTWSEVVYMAFHCCSAHIQTPRYGIRDLHNHDLPKGWILPRLVLKTLFTNQYSSIAYLTELDASMENYENLEWCSSINNAFFYIPLVRQEQKPSTNPSCNTAFHFSCRGSRQCKCQQEIKTLVKQIKLGFGKPWALHTCLYNDGRGREPSVLSWARVALKERHTGVVWAPS